MDGEKLMALSPSETIELLTFRRMLNEDLDPVDQGEVAMLLQTATDAVLGGMDKEKALTGLIECLVSRLKGARRELCDARADVARLARGGD